MKRLWLTAATLLLVAACSNPFSTVDQSKRMILQGVVTDRDTGDPLGGVYVSLEWRPESGQGSGQGPVIHVDTTTAADGSYRVEARLADVVCSTAFLRVALLGYKAVLIHPDCRSGKQTFNVALPRS